MKNPALKQDFTKDSIVKSYPNFKNMTHNFYFPKHVWHSSYYYWKWI